MALCRRFVLFSILLLGTFVMTVYLILTQSITIRNKAPDSMEELQSEILITQGSLLSRGRKREDPGNEVGYVVDQVGVDLQIEKRQEERKQRMKEFCKSYKKTNKQIPKGSFHHVIVSDKYKLLYCYIPKVACTQWKKMFLILHDKTQGIQHNDHEKYHQRWRFNILSQYSEEEIRKRLEHYYKFFFVREPFERLLSGFEDKFVSNIWNWVETPGHKHEILRRYRKEYPNATDEITLTKFIYYVLSQRDEARNEHWKSYGSLCHPCAVDYDFIGHFENLQQEAPYVLRKTGLDSVIAFPPIKSLNTSRKLLDRFSKVPQHMILQLGNAFKDDLELFNYPFPGRFSALNISKE